MAKTELVNPVAQYNELISKGGIKQLSDSVQQLLESKTGETLLKWLGQDARGQIDEAVGKMVSESIVLSVYGELTYTGVQYGKSDGKTHWSEYFTQAGRNHGKVLEIAQDYLPPVLQYQLAFMACAELHNANEHASASVAAKRAKTILNQLAPPESRPGLVMRRLHEVSLTFFSGQYDQIDGIVQPLLFTFKKTIELVPLPMPELLEYSCVLYALSSLQSFSRFMMSGDWAALTKAQTDIQNAKKMVLETGNPELVYILNKLRISMRSLSILSLWNLVAYFEKAGVSGAEVVTYIENKIKDRVYQLYPTQLQALDDGILNSGRQSVLIAMPTGSGKTTIAEFVILASFFGEAKARTMVYMAPSRALVYEKYDDFSKSLSNRNIRVSQLTGELILEQENLVRSSNLLIVTPEKLDMLMRNGFYDLRPGVLIVDEFHNIAVGHRGIKMQFDIIRYVTLYAGSRVVLMSAIVPNTDEASNWIAGGTPVVSYWRPTFARVGVLEKYPGEAILRFSDGVSRRIPLEEDFTKGYKRFAAFITTRLASEGPCMLFSPTKDDVIPYAQLITSYLQHEEKAEESPTRTDLLRRMEKLIGNDAKIMSIFRSGVGIHRGDTPHQVRRIVEEGVRKGVFRIVVSTTTLAEGINLPLKTILIPIAKVAREPMELGLFFNLLGRAGRPGREVEGQVVFLAPSRKGHPDVTVYQTARPQNLKPIETAILSILEIENKIEDSNRNKTDYEQRVLDLLWAALASELVAAISEGIAERPDSPDLVRRLIVNVNDLQHGVTMEDILDVLGRAQSILEETGVLDKTGLTSYGRDVVYRSGFSPQSCRNIEDKLVPLLPELDKLRFPPSFDENRIWIRIAEAMEAPVEASFYLTETSPIELAQILLDWMRGRELSQLAKRHYRGDMMEAMTELQGMASSFAAWFFYAAALIIKSKNPENRGSRLFSRLSRYAWFGTDQYTALEIMKLDISRELARDDVLVTTSVLGPSRVREFLNHPDYILSPEFKSLLSSRLRYSEPEDFLKSLYAIVQEAKRAGVR